MVGFAIDILRGDLEGVEEQAGAARIEAGAEQPRYDLGDSYLDGGGIFQQRELDVVQLELFALAMVCTRSGNNSKPTRAEPEIGIVFRRFDVTT